MSTALIIVTAAVWAVACFAVYLIVSIIIDVAKLVWKMGMSNKE
jgi:uncharacterized membrane protein